MTNSPAMVIPYSVIIPAHNEEQTIGRLIEHLVDTNHDECEIIVVCNGCTDDTIAVVKKYCPRVQLITTETASKTHALELGDNKATFWPRIYIDADVIIDKKSINILVSFLIEKQLLAIAPSVENNLSLSSWLVKAFYRIWCILPYYKEGMIGSGIYCLSKKGRCKFKKWPNLISDDGFIRALFLTNERGICREAKVVVNAPKRIWDLIKTKSRSRLGRYQLAYLYPDLCKQERKDKNYGNALFCLLKKPSLYLYLPVYISVNLLVRVRAKVQFSKIDTYQWEKDLSTRGS